MLSAWKRQTRVYASVGLLALLCGLIMLLGAAAPRAHAQNPPPQEPGVTQRVFQLPRALSEICPIKEGQTPNVDVLKPTIDWSGDGDFGGLTDNFIVHVIANLTVPTAGTYTFRLTSDDGSELFIDDGLVIDHDGLHGETDKDGDGRADRRDARAADQLLRGGRRPGADAELEAARREHLQRRPELGAEHRRGRRARDLSRLEAVRGRRRLARRRASARRRQPRLRPRQPAAGRLRAEGDRPGVDGRRPARADLGRRRRRPEQRDRRRRGVEAERRQGRRRPRRRDAHEDRRGPARADGHQGRRRRHLHLREAPAEQADRRRRERDLRGEGRDRDVAVRRQLPRVRVRPALQGRLLLPEPVGLDRPRRRDDRAAGLRRSRHAPEDQQGHGRDRVRRRRPAHAARHRLGPGGRDLRHRQPGRLAAGQQADPHPAGQVLQPLHDRPDRARPAASTTSGRRRRRSGCRTTRSRTRRASRC